MHTIVTLSGVSFEIPNGRLLFSDLNFSLGPGLTALVGPNGVGKTSLAKILVGDLLPTRGSIRRNVSLTFFPQRSIPEAVTVDEFLALDYTWTELGEKLLTDIDRQSLCTQLSGGELMRVRLARVLDDQFLILDEPTNDLDRDGREALLQFLRARRGGALLISHDRECLALCEEILELSNQGLAKYGGGWKAYEVAKKKERANLNTTLENAKRNRDKARADRVEQLDRQQKRNRHGAEAARRGGMPKILLGARKRRAEATTGKVDSSTLERANAQVREAFAAFQDMKTDPLMYADLIASEIPAQKLVAEARGFNIRFHDWLYYEDLSFSWRGNIRLALKGANGSGKSTLLEAILGHEFGETRGELNRGHLVTLYIDQRCAQLDDSKSILENVREVSTLDENAVRNGLARFLFTKDAVFQTVGSLSGGERLRAALACGFLSTEKPEFLVLDEPTNNLDLANIEFLETLVARFGGALLVISHDEMFLRNCGITGEFILK